MGYYKTKLNIIVIISLKDIAFRRFLVGLHHAVDAAVEVGVWSCCMSILLRVRLDRQYNMLKNISLSIIIAALMAIEREWQDAILQEI